MWSSFQRVTLGIPGILNKEERKSNTKLHVCYSNLHGLSDPGGTAGLPEDRITPGAHTAFRRYAPRSLSSSSWNDKQKILGWPYLEESSSRQERSHHCTISSFCKLKLQGEKCQPSSPPAGEDWSHSQSLGMPQHWWLVNLPKNSSNVLSRGQSQEGVNVPGRSQEKTEKLKGIILWKATVGLDVKKPESHWEFWITNAPCSVTRGGAAGWIVIRGQSLWGMPYYINFPSCLGGSAALQHPAYKR